MPTRARAVATSDADIQLAVFREFGQTPESQRFAKAAMRVVARYRAIPPAGLRRGKKPAAASAKMKRRWLEGVERRAFRLASDIDRIQTDGALFEAFEKLSESLAGRPPPGFPDVGLVIRADLNEQFLNVLALAFAAQEVGRTWSPGRGAPRMIWRDSVLQELARDFEKSYGTAPSLRKRDSFSEIAHVVLRACGFRNVDSRDAVKAALTGPSRVGVGRILLIDAPVLRALPELKRRSGKK